MREIGHYNKMLMRHTFERYIVFNKTKSVGVFWSLERYKMTCRGYRSILGIISFLMIFTNSDNRGDIRKLGVLSPIASYLGTQSWERVGYCLSGVGDVNGDGYDDFAIGNFHSNSGSMGELHNAGSTFLILGKSSGFQFNVSLNNADARFWGKQAYDAVGYDIGGKGDINGDGFDDILVGAPAGDDNVPDNPGHAYLVFGKSNPDWGSNFILEDNADASFDGEVGFDKAGLSVAIIGDINKDGFDEFIVGAPNSDEQYLDRGKAYLFKGKSSGWYRHIPLTDADIVFHGDIDQGLAGYSVSGVGDVNGDGIIDFAIGAYHASKVYLLFGKEDFNWAHDFNLSNADVIFSGEGMNTTAGWKVTAGGDVNGDGYDDFLISDNHYDTPQGKVYVIFGKPTQSWVSTDLSQSDASYIGFALGAGSGGGGNFDSNNDGLSDFLIGAPLNSRNGPEAGEAYLVMGKREGWQNSVNVIGILDYFLGESGGDLAGYAVNSAGDFNHDGADDFVISAPFNDDAGLHDFGKIYLFLGNKEFETVTGSVKYYSGSPVSNVTIQVDGEPVTSTDMSAVYSTHLQTGSNHTITPSKTAGEDMGQFTISSYDAALIARRVVGLDGLTSLQGCASDVDGDGAVLMYDAVQVARYAVGLTDVGGDLIGSWVFNPEERVYYNINGLQENQDYTAMIVGDVDGGWYMNPSMSKQRENSFFTSLWNNSSHVAGDTLTLLFSITGSIPLLSFDLALTYEEEVLRLIGVEKNDIGKSFHIFSSADHGNIRLGGFCLDPVEEEGEFISLKFGISDDTKIPIQIVLNTFQLNQEVVGEKMIMWKETFLDQSCDFRIKNNYPNPFNSFTTFEFEVYRENRIRIVIFNQKGSIVRELMNKPLNTGHYSLTWDGTTDKGITLASGIYILTIASTGSVKSMKVMLLK